MTATSGLLMLLVVGASSYLFRSGVILFIGNRPLPERFTRTLQSVAPAVLSALVITMVAGGEGAGGIGFSEVVALVVGGVIARRSKNLLLGLAIGMIVFWGLSALT